MDASERILQNQIIIMQALHLIGLASPQAFGGTGAALQGAVTNTRALLDEAATLEQRGAMFAAVRGGLIEPFDDANAVSAGADGVRHIHFHPPEGSVLTAVGHSVTIEPAAEADRSRAWLDRSPTPMPNREPLEPQQMPIPGQIVDVRVRCKSCSPPLLEFETAHGFSAWVNVDDIVRP